MRFALIFLSLLITMSSCRTNDRTRLLKPLVGTESPSFDNYENIDGSTTSLSDFKGKYVYIDVWATWCGPCRTQIPYLKMIEERYSDKNIEFISISVDKLNAKGKWKNMIAEKQMTGIQLFADNGWESSFITGLKINSIPRFILIDDKGMIVDPDAPRPSDEEWIDMLFEDIK